jgi:uncharacterized membrane protein YgcG
VLRILLLVAILTSAKAGVALAQADAALPAETVSFGQTFGMLLFLLVGALIVLSVVAKILIVTGVVPMRPETTLHRIVHGLARVVGRIERKEIRRSTSAGGGRGSGGSFGSGGASGEF